MNGLRDSHWRFAGVLIAAAALAAILIGASQVGAGDATRPSPDLPQPLRSRPATPEPSLFAGIEQQGAALGSPNAPVTLVEYADLQCPFCAQWARDTLPTLVEDYVKGGKLRIVFAWFGKSERPVQIIASGRAPRASSGMISGFGLASAITSGWSPIDLTMSRRQHVGRG